MGPRDSQSSAKTLATLRQALRLLLLRPTRQLPLLPGDWTLAAFAAFSLGLWLLLDRLQYGDHAQFMPLGAPGFSWYALSVLLAAWLTSRITNPRIDFRSSLLLLLTVLPFALTAHYLLFSRGVVPKLQTAALCALITYLIVYAAVGLHTLSGRAQAPAVAGLVLLGAILIAVDSTVAADPTLWYEREPESAEAALVRWDKAEELLVSQPAHINAAVSRIVPAPVGTPGVYFVGFAGVGRQKVFAEEIKLAAKRIAERYGSTDRSLLLLNDQRDVSSYPLATVSGLRLALKGIASKMNLEEDVLFLALSSHGSANPALSVSNGMLPLHDLTGSDLAAALRESGIKWKVIIIWRLPRGRLHKCVTR